MSAGPLSDFLRERAEGAFLPWRVQREASERFGVSFAQAEGLALELGLMPARYKRNRETLSLDDQLRLFRATVAVVGCGGLGGYLIEELARIGVGNLVAIDPDVFEEHNLNRQLLSSPATLGKAKVEAARARVAQINPAVSVAAHRASFSRENGPQLFSACTAVLDGLDNNLVRRDLAAVCRELALPLVHGAIAGWYGQIAVQMPGEDLSFLFRSAASSSGKGLEQKLGNPSFTPAVIASLQVAELIKVLLGRGKPLCGRVLFVNLLDMEFQEVRHD